MKNRIAKLVEIGRIEIFEDEVPKLKENEALVSIKSGGICGSDLHYFKEGGLGSFKQPLPMHTGHEPSGIVVDYKGNNEFKSGDRVAIEPSRVCLECKWCLKGKHNLCEKGIFMGANSQGAFADYVVVDKTQLVKIPDSMSYNLGALLEPLGVGLHAINLIEPKPTESATIVGVGPIGLCLMSVLKKFGFNTIYAVDKLAYRVEFAKNMGATESFLFDSAVADIKKLTNKKGTTYVFDTGGEKDSINACIEIVGVSGAIGLLGIPTDDYIPYNPHKLRTKEVRLQNVRRSNQTLEDCAKLYSGDNSIEKIVTHEFDFEDIQKGFELVSKYGDEVIKCMIINNHK